MSRYLISAAACLLAACSAQADEPVKASAEVERTAPTDPKLTTEQVRPGLHVIFGPGGNIGVSSGDDGVVLIDDKFAENADEILFRVSEISDGDLLFVINTHLHGDHTGSNAEMAAAGALVMAHENVRTRMGISYMNEAFGRMNEAKSEALWPVVTFTDRAALHFNGISARAIHVPNAHTDGDAIVMFDGANTIHMGDTFFLGMFPFVDVDAGGSLQGMLAAHDTALALADADTVIIPGHGPVTDKAGLQAARDTLQTILTRVETAKSRGQSVEQIIAAKPLADLSDMDGFIKQDGMIRAAYRSLD